MNTRSAILLIAPLAAVAACATSPDQPAASSTAATATHTTTAAAPSLAPGDTMNYIYSRKGIKEQALTEKVVQVGADTIDLAISTPDRNYTAVLDRDTLVLKKAMCLSNGQQCEFSPGLTWVRFPLSVGQEWKSEFKVSGETFESNVALNWKVVGMERVKVKGGEFDAYKLTATGSISGTTKTGASFSGTESSTCWSAPAAKMFCVKYAYNNSFGEKSARELVSYALQRAGSSRAGASGATRLHIAELGS